MKAGLLRSQFADLESPGPEEALTVDFRASPEMIVKRILADLPAWPRN